MFNNIETLHSRLCGECSKKSPYRDILSRSKEPVLASDIRPY